MKNATFTDLYFSFSINDVNISKWESNWTVSSFVIWFKRDPVFNPFSSHIADGAMSCGRQVARGLRTYFLGISLSKIQRRVSRAICASTRVAMHILEALASLNCLNWISLLGKVPAPTSCFLSCNLILGALVYWVRFHVFLHFDRIPILAYSLL